MSDKLKYTKQSKCAGYANCACGTCIEELADQIAATETQTTYIVPGNSSENNMIYIPPASLTLNTLVELAHTTAKEKGWWDTPREAGTLHMLMVSEIAEATEAARKDILPMYRDGNTGKLEGEAVELADCLLRIADYFGHKGWDLDAIVKAKMEYNNTRSYKHGGKKF